MTEAATAAEPDFFAVFGVERAYAIERDALEERYLELSAAAHPDRFAGASAGERRRAVERASVINEAYRTLRDPVRRAEYLVKLGGIDLDRTDPERGAPDPGKAFLIEMIELREALEEAQGAGVAAVDGLREQIEARADEALDAGIDAITAGDVRGAARHLVVHRYLHRFLDEVDGEHDAG
ncbi:MAG: Fe-S protein assembly co-chaperone HscB [Myxococcales bacterium]|nr:Fe-S protein assembly co-chaperone HscB [Myxococcales bacterium]